MRSGTHHFVISSATMMSSFRMSAVKEMETMLRNSVSNRSNERIMIAPPTREKKGSARTRREEIRREVGPWKTETRHHSRKVLNDKERPWVKRGGNCQF